MHTDPIEIGVRLRESLTEILRRIAPDDPRFADLAGEVLADGLTRYMVHGPRPGDAEELEVLIGSLEFWAGLHGYSRRKPVQMAKGPRPLAVTARAGS